MIHVPRGQYIHTSTRIQGRGEERREVQVHVGGLLKMMIQQQYVRGTRWIGDYFFCSYSCPAIPTAGTRMHLACDTIIMDFSSSRPFHCFPPSVYASPFHNRSNSYLQHYGLVFYHIVSLGSNLSLLRSLSALFTICLMGMRRAAGGRRPAAAKPPWYDTVMCRSLGARS